MKMETDCSTIEKAKEGQEPAIISKERDMEWIPPRSLGKKVQELCQC